MNDQPEVAAQEPAGEGGHHRLQPRRDERDLVLVHDAVDGLGRRRDAVPEQRGLHTAVRTVVRREAVERLAVVRPVDPDGVPLEGAHPADGVEPEHDLPLDEERDAEVGEQLGSPGAGADHQPVGLVRAL